MSPSLTPIERNALDVLPISNHPPLVIRPRGLRRGGRIDGAVPFCYKRYLACDGLHRGQRCSALKRQVPLLRFPALQPEPG